MFYCCVNVHPFSPLSPHFCLFSPFQLNSQNKYYQVEKIWGGICLPPSPPQVNAYARLILYVLCSVKSPHVMFSKITACYFSKITACYFSKITACYVQ